MKQNELMINVVGLAGSGKTTVQLLITDMLRKHGFDVEIINRDFVDETQLRKHTNPNTVDRINAILEKTKKITIAETQANSILK